MLELAAGGYLVSQKRSPRGGNVHLQKTTAGHKIEVLHSSTLYSSPCASLITTYQTPTQSTPLCITTSHT